MHSHSRKAILLDLGGVLVDVNHEHAVAAFSKKTGRSEHTVRKVFQSNSLYYDFNSGLIDAPQFRQQVLSSLDAELGNQEFDSAWAATLSPLSHIGALLQSTAVNHNLYLLSNTDPIHFSWVETHSNWLQHFNGLHLSFQVGLCKPHQSYYKSALERFDLNPTDCLFFDDLLANVQAARKVGIEAHQVTGNGLQPADLPCCVTLQDG